MQDIEYPIDPTLQRCHIWSLERIEIFVATPNCPRIKNCQLKYCVLSTKSVIRVPCIISNTNVSCIYTKLRAKWASLCQDIHRNQFARELPLQQQKIPRFKISLLGLRCGAISASAVDQVYLGCPETPICARKGSGLAKISATQGVAPPEALRRVSLEIDFSGLRGRAISASTVDQFYLGGPETPICSRKG